MGRRRKKKVKLYKEMVCMSFFFPNFTLYIGEEGADEMKMAGERVQMTGAVELDKRINNNI